MTTTSRPGWLFLLLALLTGLALAFGAACGGGDDDDDDDDGGATATEEADGEDGEETEAPTEDSGDDGGDDSGDEDIFSQLDELPTSWTL